ncbi:ABC transporter substrate-binding protein [Paraburkholderia sp. USG1]|uniref:ABC transporter substrate-binding protein n=1 Tax=Paraburkholderia sp. USG1 TaxID=2952268 RepID=UPI0028595933|nr:ABC transporter substrate-binding protein [Paraburkholderia sp. USG1]MDR8398414.1 ABC transporter substrate-binding protein [Paraburkholderia sp. USG1]
MLAVLGVDVRAQVLQTTTATRKIALSNNYAGNAWRQAMLKDWAVVAKQAQVGGKVAAAPSFTTAENQVTEQAQQIQNLILQGYNAIVIDAASPTALNGVIRQACAAGVVVVSYDGTVTEPCAYRVSFDFRGWGEQEADYLGKRLGGKGNILEVRGLAGVSVDEEIHQGLINGLKRYPGVKIVASVNGNWTQTVAQKAVAGVLPTLPTIDGVATQGDDGFGTAEAFRAAGRTMPVIVLGNRYDELKWWKGQAASGYTTTSVSNPPGGVTAAFWVAQQALAGAKMPKDIQVPLLAVTQDTLDATLAKMQPGGVSDTAFTVDQTMSMVNRK